MSDAPQILPPESQDKRRTSLRAAWARTTPAQRRWAIALSASFLFAVFMFAFGQFTQIRGVQNMLASRIFLGIAWLSVSLIGIGIVRALGFRHWQRVALLVVAVLLLAAVALDRIFPMPKASVTPAAQTPAKRAPLITIKIHNSAFPVSVPPRSTLYILPLHPYQTFTDAASRLHEYENACAVDHPWPSQDEIDSKAANTYEEVRSVEITNHAPDTMESGRLVFGVLYNQSQLGGCSVPPQSASKQDDVISIPTLDQGKTFDFVVVNQTAGCAWLLPPGTITATMAADEREIDVPLKLEPTVVSNWLSSPFGPTTIKWEGVPAKNPGYGMVRSGANCDVPKTDKTLRLSSEREGERKKKLEIRTKLGKLLEKNHLLKAQCGGEQPTPPNFSCQDETNAWGQEVITFITQNMESSYKARFDSAIGLNYSWPWITDKNVENAINVLNHKADALAEFIKEQQ